MLRSSYDKKGGDIGTVREVRYKLLGKDSYDLDKTRAIGIV